MNSYFVKGFVFGMLMILTYYLLGIKLVIVLVLFQLFQDFNNWEF